ncbi:RNA polymerase sigma factor RpoE [soil metagenome]
MADGLLNDALAGSPSARAALLETAAGLRASRKEELDLILDDLATRAAGGDDTALEMLLELVHRLGLARPAITSMVMDSGQVDDIAQLALIAVEQRIGQYEGRAKFRTWLWTVARNEALMSLRRRQALPVEEIPETGARFSSMIAGRQTIKAIIEGLPDPYRETLSLQLYADLDYDAIAGRLGVPVGTVRSRLAKARDLLRSSLVT